MKQFSIKISTPCNEYINNIKPNKKGFHCNVCTKNILDLTLMSPNEIVKILKDSNQDICAILSKQQLYTPILHYEPIKHKTFPYFKWVTGVMLASSLFSTSRLHAQTSPQTLYEQHTPITPLSNKNHSYIEKKIPKPIQTKQFNGKVIYKNTNNFKHNTNTLDSIPIENAKIEFVCLDRIYTTYTNKNGEFKLNIPNQFVKPKNIIHVSYQEISTNSAILAGKSAPFYFNNHSLVIRLKEFENFQYIKAKSKINVVGQVSSSQIDFFNPFQKPSVPVPIILYNGIEINYQEHSKMKRQKKNMYKLENKKQYYLRPYLAKILYGERAQHGLFLYFD